MCNEKESMFYLFFKQKPLIKKNFVFQSQTTCTETSTVGWDIYFVMFWWVSLDQSILKYTKTMPKQERYTKEKEKRLKAAKGCCSITDMFIR